MVNKKWSISCTSLWRAVWLDKRSFCDIFCFALHLRPQATSGPQFDVLLMVLMNREYRKYFRGDSTVLMNLYLRGEGKDGDFCSDGCPM